MTIEQLHYAIHPVRNLLVIVVVISVCSEGILCVKNIAAAAMNLNQFLPCHVSVRKVYKLVLHPFDFRWDFHDRSWKEPWIESLDISKNFSRMPMFSEFPLILLED